jgi:hypothetical protein
MADEPTFIERIKTMEDDSSLYAINICVVRTSGDDILVTNLDDFRIILPRYFFLMSNFPKRFNFFSPKNNYKFFRKKPT